MRFCHFHSLFSRTPAIVAGSLFLLAAPACTPKPAPTVRCRGYSPDAEDISEIVIDYARDLQEKHRLYLYDSRVIFDEKIQKIRIDFTSQASILLCEGREVLFDVVEGYLKRLDEHVTIRGKFNRPLTARDLEIHITYQSYFNSYIDPEFLAYIIMDDGWSFFYSSELNESFTDKWMQKVEPYFKTHQFATFQRQTAARFEEESLKDKATALAEDRILDSQLYEGSSSVIQ